MIQYKGLGENVYKLMFGADMKGFDESLSNMFMNQVIINVNVFNKFMENRVSCNMNRGLTVYVGF